MALIVPIPPKMAQEHGIYVLELNDNEKFRLYLKSPPPNYETIKNHNIWSAIVQQTTDNEQGKCWCISKKKGKKALT